MIAFFILDQFWWLAIPGLLLGFYAQMRLSSNYNRYVRVPVSTGLTGGEAARAILDRAGLHDVGVNAIPGHLTDHYDPIKRALFLSSENYHGRSLAAVGVAAHEAGHALQHQEAYAPLKLRMALVPITGFASQAVVWIFVLSFIMNFMNLVGLAVAAYAVITLFQAITLPVEFDASRRARQHLFRLGIVRDHEGPGVSRVLNAAALTYVAALVSAFLTLLHFILIARGANHD